MASFQAGTAVAPSSQVEISVACKNLRDKDAFSKSDPVVVVFTKDVRTNSYYEFGRSEMIKNCLNPQFVKKFIMNYFFEESQKLKFEVYDVDSPSQRLDAHDFLGRLECTLGEIVSALGGKLEKPMTGLKGTPGQIIIRAEEISSCKESVTMHFCATHLDKKDFLGKSDPFLVFYRANEDNSYTTVHKTEVIKNTLNPTWRPFTIPARALCNGDYDRNIRVECYDWDGDGGHDLIGEFTTNLREMTRGGSSGSSYQPFTREVINPKKKAKKKNYKNSGQVTLMNCKIEIHPSFLDYVKGGTQLNFTVAIDFTASNGNPASPTSLHYYSPYQPNQYGAAIQAVGEIIQDYDSDKMFPVLGFGGKLPDGSVSHEFPLNFNSANPYCAGIQGIMQAYYGALQKVQLYGPTNFSPVIQHVARFASSMRDGNSYFVLLILTDGVITDLPNTIEAIVHSSGLPMSIIIVGVGNAEFDAMDVLDADNNRLSSRGKQAVRDIVQFVPFRDFMGGKFGNNMQISQAALAKEVLAEIPDQFLQYMKANNIKPKTPKENISAPGQGPPQMAPPPGGAPSMAPPPGGAANMPSHQGMPNQGMSPYPQAPPPAYPQEGPQKTMPPRPPPPGGASAPPYPR
ncbi:copine-8-like isoform X2 [Ylistrum balloti]|uniref:copine-8-like isoform X2 n=1 Tax=Ylistrum balloti TaxID=509963 RepID=UPI0029059E7E|nr:copine-8-like isoform X2 [Ylistrum balloti]